MIHVQSWFWPSLLFTLSGALLSPLEGTEPEAGKSVALRLLNIPLSPAAVGRESKTMSPRDADRLHHVWGCECESVSTRGRF